MQVITYQAEEVNERLHLDGLEPAKVPITCWYGDADAELSTKGRSQLLNKRHEVVGVFQLAAAIGFPRTTIQSANSTAIDMKVLTIPSQCPHLGICWQQESREES